MTEPVTGTVTVTETVTGTVTGNKPGGVLVSGDYTTVITIKEQARVRIGQLLDRGPIPG